VPFKTVCYHLSGRDFRHHSSWFSHFSLFTTVGFHKRFSEGSCPFFPTVSQFSDLRLVTMLPVLISHAVSCSLFSSPVFHQTSSPHLPPFSSPRPHCSLRVMVGRFRIPFLYLDRVITFVYFSLSDLAKSPQPASSSVSWRIRFSLLTFSTVLYVFSFFLNFSLFFRPLPIDCLPSGYNSVALISIESGLCLAVRL